MSLVEVPASPTGLAASLAQQQVSSSFTKPVQSTELCSVPVRVAPTVSFWVENGLKRRGSVGKSRRSSWGTWLQLTAVVPAVLLIGSRCAVPAINPLPGQGADNSGAEVQRTQVLGSTFQSGAHAVASPRSVLPSRRPGWLQAGRRCWSSWCCWVSSADMGGGCVAGGKGSPC